MAEVKKYGALRHFRGDPTSHVLRFRRGKLSASGRGLTFWFHPLSTSIAEVPVDDRELPFLFHERSRDFQDAVVQGVISFRVEDPEKLAERVDFSIDLKTGALLKQPLEKLSGTVTELAQQFAWDYMARNDLRAVLKSGVEEIRGLIEEGLRRDAGLAGMGIAIVSVRVGAINPEADMEKALQTPAREAIQQEADQATFERRALAVEKERAIRENELQNEIELARREQTLIEEQGRNERKRATEAAEAARIDAEAEAARVGLGAHAEAQRIGLVESARVQSEQERMAIYRDMPTQVMYGLAAQKLAGTLKRIDHLNLTPDMLGPLMTNLVEAGTRRLDRNEGS